MDMQEKSERIIQLIYRRKSTEIHEEKERKLKELEENDNYLIELRQIEDNMINALEDIQERVLEDKGVDLLLTIPEDYVCITSEYNKEEKDKIQIEANDKIKELMQTLDEVKAHIDLAETREDVLSILEQYDLIDKKTKKIK